MKVRLYLNVQCNQLKGFATFSNQNLDQIPVTIQMKKFLGENIYLFLSSAIYPFPSVLQSQHKLYWLSLSHFHQNLICKGRTQMTLSQGPSTLYQKKKKISRKNSSFSTLLLLADPLKSHMNGLCWSPSSDVPGFASFSDSTLNDKLLALFESQEGTLTNNTEKNTEKTVFSCFHDRNLSVVLTFPLQSHISWNFSLFQSKAWIPPYTSNWSLAKDSQPWCSLKSPLGRNISSV